MGSAMASSSAWADSKMNSICCILKSALLNLLCGCFPSLIFQSHRYNKKESSLLWSPSSACRTSTSSVGEKINLPSRNIYIREGVSALHDVCLHFHVVHLYLYIIVIYRRRAEELRGLVQIKGWMPEINGAPVNTDIKITFRLSLCIICLFCCCFRLAAWTHSVSVKTFSSSGT